MEYFCAICGHKSLNNTTRTEKTGDYNLSCPLCLAGIRFYISLNPSRTQEETNTIFEQTELTNSQRYGGGGKGRSGGKRKSKGRRKSVKPSKA